MIDHRWSLCIEQLRPTPYSFSHSSVCIPNSTRDAVCGRNLQCRVTYKPAISSETLTEESHPPLGLSCIHHKKKCFR
jgi:hypothetical protein